MPSSAQLAFLSLTELASLIAKKKISPVELTRSHLERIERFNPALNAFLTVLAGSALQSARRAERLQMRGGKKPPLLGVPIALKDNIWTRGIRTTAGSKVLRDFVPTESATVAERLDAAGAVLLGKTHLHEFAYGVTTNNAHYGPARNPWNLDCIPGGSTGGSGAALAAGLCAGSVGSDTGGSIRIPAALCGVAGIKPTFGRVSCYGVVPLAPTLDHVGPLARTVEDLALLLGVIAGPDPRDITAEPRPVPDYLRSMRAVERERKKLRLGWPRHYFFDRVEPEIRRAVEKAARILEKLGARIEEVDLPGLADSVEPSTHIALAEARLVHESAGWYPSRAADYSDEVRKRLEMGAEIRAVDYLRALEVKRAVRREFDAALERVHAIIAPATPLAATPISQTRVRIEGYEEDVRMALLRMNRPSNLTGLPAISVPCGFTRSGLPIGLQLIGRAWDEARLLGIARLYEQATEWHLRRPEAFMKA
ncbi:MAG TPA: amidase [Candidatus Acidoferrales bacterium]